MVLSTRDLNRLLRQRAQAGGTVTAERLSGQHCVAVGLDNEATVELEGRAGDYFGALNKAARIRLKGPAGRFAADTMSGGELVIEGDAGAGLGFSLSGGTVVVKGSVAGRAGQMIKRGLILIDGNVGDTSGLYALGGEIVVTGDAGDKTGDWIIAGRMYVGGKIASLGHNATVVPLDADDESRLASYFKAYGIQKDPAGFKKVAPLKVRPFYSGKEEPACQGAPSGRQTS
ncbi:MAG: hypothetical protein K6T75_07830 [Acetobacteraceae bacterium]|nr:hypothetical protein [Acetobacteraceae bacterium]